ncbi:MAG: hypothetical protein QG602_3189 [Verrucomicrobiota bacterium]|jgi:hypothetical protein|nr:hypothetical protein [Verrucomicrobiota bacterium]
MNLPRVFVVLLGLIAGAAALSVYLGRAKVGESLTTRAQFEQLRPGDRIVYVCRQCDAKRTVTLTSVAEALEYCREGAMLSCPGCKDEMRVVLKQAPGATGSAVEVQYVNKKGHECLTIAKALPET